MFLSRRSAQAEYFDGERPAAELADFCRSMERVNRLFGLDEPFRRHLPRLLTEPACRSLTVLDLGASDGWLGRQLTRWAAQRGWDWRFTNLDLTPASLRLNPHGSNLAASALALPFGPGSFDLVLASQMTHHLNDQQVIQHFREAWRVARKAVFFADLHRNALLYCLLWLLFLFQRHSTQFRSDALLSVRRSWRITELRKLAQHAGLNDPTVKLYFSARVLLWAIKNQR